MSTGVNSLHSKLVSLISRGQELTSIFFYAPAKEKCHLEDTIASATWGLPLVIWRTDRAVILNGFIGEGLLVLACLPGFHWRALLGSLSRSLKYLRQARILIEFVEDRDEFLVSEVLQFCLSHDMINVNAIFADFSETENLSSFEAYPSFEVVNQTFTPDTQVADLYPNKMLDLRESFIRTMPDYSVPNTILYQDTEGNKEILGYLWDLLKAYAQKHNAQLQVVNKNADDRPLNYIELLEAAQSGIVDLCASIQPMSMGSISRMHEMSYPVNQASWCTMLPVERQLHGSELLSRVLPYPTFALLLILWILYELLRGRWRRHSRLQSIGWLVLATLVSTNYVGRLLNLFTDPPSLPPINSLSALMESPVRIISERSEYSAIEFTQRTKYSAAFHLALQASILIGLRNAFNTSYGYTITSEKWKIYEEQQKRSSKPVFRYSKDLCFYEMIPFGLVIPENSPHRAPLHSYTLLIRQSGLHDFWVNRGFSYMVKAGKINFTAIGKRYQAETLKFTDLRHVFIVYVSVVLISMVLFTCELFVSWVNYWLGF
ncbi:uncharacterized protein LOC6537887 [Drosophila yakuba]|uniref:Ionotropic glutamate receptor C-terminal domain-containing protein n=1 Tax=Drosophila yakuba TaxID=7245 RepID=B4PN85_DROYA|nr:uncharacterized protein LOC6537887 [Drosophila yakuba]EDW98140.1 uncharacterized protein Dyak_GE10373 [Drosophila yakuba]